ncbi:hypothetical protein TURU_099629 [Turdus rufiventris]|nr:hypothetical protein TURU_099629 [Turdus rufiventris]
MSFGEMEEDSHHEDLRVSLAQSGSGHTKQTQVSEATKASKNLQRTLKKQNVIYRGKCMIQEHSSGTASSMAFSHLQGFEIVNPQASKKRLRPTRIISPAWPSSSRSRGTKVGNPSYTSPLEPPNPTPCHSPHFFPIRIWVLGEFGGVFKTKEDPAPDTTETPKSQPETP